MEGAKTLVVLLNSLRAKTVGVMQRRGEIGCPGARAHANREGGRSEKGIEGNNCLDAISRCARDLPCLLVSNSASERDWKVSGGDG
jgi:hypothetical protein